MPKKTILIDMDDVLENFVEAWLRKLNEKYNLSMAHEDIFEWDLCKCIPELSIEEIHSVIRDNAFWSTVTPKYDAIKYVKKLQEHFNVYVVTATDYHSIKSKMDDLLFKWFPYLDWNHVIITSNKQLVKGDYIIDDGVHNLVGHDAFRMLYNTPHNKIPASIENELNIFRVFSWKDIYETIMNREGLSEQIDYT